MLLCSAMIVSILFKLVSLMHLVVCTRGHEASGSLKFFAADHQDSIGDRKQSDQPNQGQGAGARHDEKKNSEQYR
jgi:hypothetical protein